MSPPRRPGGTARRRGVSSVGASMEPPYGRDIVVIGASAGGLQAVQALLHELPGDLRACLLVVIHTSPSAVGVMPDLLSRAGTLPVVYARDGAPIEHGKMMVAPPDHHLLVEDSHVRLIRGPRENGFRPAIDPLFRTAAWAYGPRVVGVLLSGALDDGTEGLLAIQQAGGRTLVQDPAEATFPAMPLSAMRHVEVDHVATVREIAKQLVQLSENGSVAVEPAVPPEPKGESEDMERLEHGSGPPAAFTCPDCGGALADISHEGVIRFQC